MSIKLLSISYAKRVLHKDSREQERLKIFSSATDEHVMIILTLKSDGLPSLWQEGNLTVYGTNTYTKLGILFEALLIGVKVIKQNKKEKWVVTCQDPFDTSLIGFPLSWFKNAVLHIQLHGDNFGNPAWQAASFLNIFRYRFGLFMLKHAASIRVVSLRIRSSLLRLGVDDNKISVLPVYVDLKTFLTVGKDRSYELDGPVKFIYAGRFSEEKQLPTLIEAVAQLKDRIDFTLTLLGDGKDKRDLKTQVDNLNLQSRVKFKTWTDDVSGVFSKHDVFILPSAHEGYALVLLEAMAAGMPVITTDVGCVGELVKDLQHGLVVDGSVDSMSAAILDLSSGKMVSNIGAKNYNYVKSLQLSKEEYSKKWFQTFIF